MADFRGYKAATIYELLDNKKCEILYIESNHSTHTEYAIKGIDRVLKIYVEKPISTSWDQFSQLLNKFKEKNAEIYARYNRPFSKAFNIINPHIEDVKKPISSSCFISAHQLGDEHWYRTLEEGTRIAGNVGHWIDLRVYLMAKRGHIPETFNIGINYADKNHLDDNISITVSNKYSDIMQLMLSARNETFESIIESVDFQCGDLIAKIDDYRHMKLLKN